MGDRLGSNSLTENTVEYALVRVRISLAIQNFIQHLGEAFDGSSMWCLLDTRTLRLESGHIWVEAHSTQESVCGRKHGEQRPDFLLLDDFETN